MNLQTANLEMRIAHSALRLAVPLGLAGVILLVLAVPPARAMPDYAARVSEPCGSCHVSAAGGGVRNARGQAWVASGRPSAVPAMLDALGILGVNLPTDMRIYSDAPASVPTPAPLKLESERLTPGLQLLRVDEGN